MVGNQAISKAINLLLLTTQLPSSQLTLVHRQEWGTCKHSDV